MADMTKPQQVSAINLQKVWKSRRRHWKHELFRILGNIFRTLLEFLRVFFPFTFRYIYVFTSFPFF